MDRQTADEVVACLVGERTLYHYYRDRYGIGLLRHLSRQRPLSVAALKQWSIELKTAWRGHLQGTLREEWRIYCLSEH